jgi:hypothetical protein
VGFGSFSIFWELKQLFKLFLKVASMLKIAHAFRGYRDAMVPFKLYRQLGRSQTKYEAKNSSYTYQRRVLVVQSCNPRL